MLTNIKKPYRFTPSENPIIWGFRSDDVECGIIIVRILQATEFITDNNGLSTLPIIYETKIYATEFNNNSTKDFYFDLQPQLNSLVKFRMDNNYDYIVGKLDNSFIYVLAITEYKKVDGEWVEVLIVQGNSGEPLYTPPYVVYNAKNDNFQYRYNSLRRYSNEDLALQDKLKYIIGGNNLVGNFLTNKPRNSFKTNMYSANQLWFLNNFYYCVPPLISGDCTNFLYVSLKDKNDNVLSYLPIDAFIPSGEASAKASLNVFNPAAGFNIHPLSIIKVNDPTYGLITLFSGYTQSFPVPFIEYIQDLSASVNLNTYGYTSVAKGKKLIVTAPIGYYETINGNFIYYSGDTFTSNAQFFGGGNKISYNSNITRLQLGTNSGNVPNDDFSIQLFADSDGVFNQTYPIDRPWREYYTTTLTATTETEFKLSGDSFNTTKIYINRTSAGLIFNDFGDTFEQIKSGDTITIADSSVVIRYGVYMVSSKSQIKDTYILNVSKISSVGSYISNDPTKRYLIGYAPGSTSITPNPTTVSTSPISEKIYFKWEEVNCDYEYVNILFSNSLGGADEIQLVNPREKRSYQKDIFKQDKKILTSLPHLEHSDYSETYVGDGYIDRIQSNIIPEEVILNNVETVKVELSTLPLTDQESQWLIELVQSKEIYICYGIDTIIPVQLFETNYEVKSKRRLTNQFIEYTFTFEFPRNYKDFIYKIVNQNT